MDPIDRFYWLTIPVLAGCYAALLIGAVIYVNARYGPNLPLSTGFVTGIVITMAGGLAWLKWMKPRPSAQAGTT
jgi:hypothetical protein